MFGLWDRGSTASGDRPERPPLVKPVEPVELVELVELNGLEDEGRLLLLKSVFDAADLRYFVKGDHFGSLTVGPRIDHYNRKTVYVHPRDVEEARELVEEFLAKTAPAADSHVRELRGRDVLRMVLEVLFFGWFMPGRRSRPAPPPRLRVIRGGRDDAAPPPPVP
jgi:hypothetical protein